MPDIYPTTSRTATATFTDSEGVSDPDEVTFTLLVEDPHQQVISHAAIDDAAVAHPATGTYATEVDCVESGKYTVHAQGQWGVGDDATYQAVQTSWYVKRSNVVPVPEGS